MKRLGVNFIILICTLVTLVTLLEGGARLLISPINGIDKDWVQKFIQYNRDGFRDRDYSFVKSAGIFRILAVGDSYTFGHGIERLEETFPKRLETLLNQGMETPKFEVLNFSMPGWNTVDQLRYIYKKGFLYQPDLIILNFFHNDLPPPIFINCDSQDREIIPKVGSSIEWFDRSSLYRFLKFRVNRLMEKYGHKPSYEDCRRSAYNSRSWNMEEIYLDTLIHTARMKNIHFMLSVLPIMLRLDESYPFAFAHRKLKQYCYSRNLLCVDLYQGVFKGKNEDDFILSREDRHFNSQGAELVAQKQFDKLKPLKSYQNLNQWHRAFDIKELLETSEITKQFNLTFPDLNISSLNLKNAKEKTLAWVEKENYYILRTSIDPVTNNQIFWKRIILERNGNMIMNERKTFDPLSGVLTRHEINENFNGKIIQTIKVLKPSNKKEFIITKQSYVFDYHSEYRKNLDKFLWELEIKENTRFLDPLTLESSLFFPDKLRLDRPSPDELKRILEFYITFPFYKAGSGVSYVQKLIGDILRIKPFKTAVQFSENLEQVTREHDRSN